MAKLLLVDSCYPFQACKAESVGIFLKERRHIIFKHKIDIFKLPAHALYKLFHFLVPRLKVFHGLLDRRSGTNYTIRISLIFDINRKPPVRTSFDNCYFVHNKRITVFYYKAPGLAELSVNL